MSKQRNSVNFIHDIIDADLRDQEVIRPVCTRFPPEPNGYLHLGHAKAICLNFGIAKHYPGGSCCLRLDDSNPEHETIAYAEAIKEDVRWLGFDWGEKLYHASDYYQQFYNFAVQLIEADKAYVDELTQEQMRQYRGSLTTPGRNSPFRERKREENLDLFQRMRDGEFAEGSRVLRARIDMASPNINLRDPTIYRIRTSSHYRTGTSWCIYPMYDFAHCLSDAIEGITHSLCTLEFEDHRALYDWYLEQLVQPPRPRQYEFARLNISHTLTSKRQIESLISAGHVNGWDDPRLPTIQGLRRRGYTAAAIRDFCARIGVTKHDTLIDMGVLENCLREDLENTAPRVLAVLRPLRLVIENYPDNTEEWLDAPFHPADPAFGSRQLPFGRELYIEQEDFMEQPEDRFFRLAPGREVRLRYAYLITCTGVVKDAQGRITELHCRYDPESRGGKAPDGRKVKATLHWVACKTAFKTTLKLYDRLLEQTKPNHPDDQDWASRIHPHSLTELSSAMLEPGLAEAKPGQHFQFERQGYFCVDSGNFKPGKPIFNRSVSLRDHWKKSATLASRRRR